MEQGTGEEKHIRQGAEEMGPVLSEQEKAEDGQKGTQGEKSD
jgi:hypothetical protein